MVIPTPKDHQNDKVRLLYDCTSGDLTIGGDDFRQCIDDVKPYGAVSDTNQDGKDNVDAPAYNDKDSDGTQQYDNNHTYKEKGTEVYIPADPPSTQRTLSTAMTFIHLFKVFTGPSILGTPRIMANGGLLFGPIGFVIIGYLNNWCNVTMVKCARILCERNGRPSMSYQDVMVESFENNKISPVIRKVAPYIRNITTFFLVIAQFGILSFYIQVIGTTAHKYLTEAIPSYSLPLIVTELLVTLVLVPYSWMRNLKVLSWFSLTANILTIISVVTIVQYACGSLQSTSSLPLITPDLWTLPLFVGSTVFTVEGIPMILPIENQTKEPRLFGGLCGLVTMATTCNICLNVMVGFYGYLSVGTDVTGNILVALPDEWTYKAISISYAFAVFLTFTLQLYLPAEVMSTAMKSKVKASWVHVHADWMCRTCIVIAAYLFAALIPNVNLLMALVGSVATVVLVFVLPPLAELCVHSLDVTGIPWLTGVKDGLIFTFGAVAFLTGTYTSLRDIINDF